MDLCPLTARLLAEGEPVHLQIDSNAKHAPAHTTLVSMGADMRGDEGAADMPPDDEFTLEPL